MEASSKSGQSASTKPEHNQFDLYLQEIEGIDDYWGPTFRQIYENKENVEFCKKLENRIRHHDKDIEYLCSIYYQGFIESVRELLEVRSQAKKLNSEVCTIDNRLQTASENISKSGEQLIQARTVQNNISVVISQLNLCLPVLKTFSKLQKQISEKRYYPALKTLGELEHNHLPHVANYRFFIQHLKDKIPVYREKIEKESMSDLKDFLENIRRFSPKIGEVAMKHTIEHLACGPKTTDRKKKRIVPNNEGVLDVDSSAETQYNDDDLSAQEMIDFSPIYRCLHISTVLGSRSTFETYYRAERTEQARLVLQPPKNMHESETSYRAYINAILGFFILEDHVLNTGDGLITRAFLDEMWTMALSKIVTALQTHSAYCTDATLILRIKDLIMLFCTTLSNYSYTVKPLWELVRELRDHYTEVLMQRWVQVFREILAKEDFQPIEVFTQEEYDDIIESFPFEDDIPAEEIVFPYKFPFSQLVPTVYQQVKEFIYACLKFSEDLNLSQVEVDEMIRKSMNLLLTRSFSGCLLSTFRSPRVNLQEIIQIIIDTGYLEQATVYLDQFISNITGEECTAPSRPHHSTLPSSAPITPSLTLASASPTPLMTGGGGLANLPVVMFRVARDDAVKHICLKLRMKLDAFIELERYDWLLVEPQGHASTYVTDLIRFLHTTFASFTNLPAEVAQIACKSACAHIADAVLRLLLDKNIQQVSMGSVHQINLDLLQCELFAASEPVQGLQQDDLLSYFTELRELLDLFTSWDWSTYFHDFGQDTSKYKTVSPDVAIVLLEKLKEGDRKTMFTVLKKSERDKKKLLETVLKQLKQLSQIPSK